MIATVTQPWLTGTLEYNVNSDTFAFSTLFLLSKLFLSHKKRFLWMLLCQPVLEVSKILKPWEECSLSVSGQGELALAYRWKCKFLGH